MKKIVFTSVIIAVIALIPLAVGAQTGGDGIVPATCTGVDCDFNDLVVLVGNIIDFLIRLATVAAAVLFAYAGVLYMTSSGDPGKIRKAHEIFKKTAIGFLIVLGAWLIVNTLVNALLGNPFFESFLGN